MSATTGMWCRLRGMTDDLATYRKAVVYMTKQVFEHPDPNASALAKLIFGYVYPWTQGHETGDPIFDKLAGDVEFSDFLARRIAERFLTATSTQSDPTLKPDWFEIETAPDEDEGCFLAYWPRFDGNGWDTNVRVTQRTCGKFLTSDQYWGHPTHWMPLPPAPEKAA